MKVTIAVFVFLVLFVSLPFLIKVRTVCNIQDDICPKVEQVSLFRAKKIAAKSLNSNSKVLEYSFQFKLPNILFVNILTKKPYYGLVDTETNTTYLLDKSGNVIATTDKTILPTVIQKGKDPNLFTLKIIDGVSLMYGGFTGEIKNESLVVDMNGGIRVIFPLSGDAEALLGGLRIIYARITSPELAGKYSQVDLRFHNPILR